MKYGGGHGHVTPRPDGARARCGGPRICPVCAKELATTELDAARRRYEDQLGQASDMSEVWSDLSETLTRHMYEETPLG